MSRLYKALVLVLKRRPLGEADEIVSLLSPDRGRFEAAVRGSRRSASPLVGRIEPFTELSGLFARGRSLDHLTQAEVHCARPALHRDLERLLLASYLVDLVGGASPPGEPCPELYGLLVQALDNLQSAPTPLLCRWVELRLADLLGYAPQLEACALCGASDPGWFSAESGGTVCWNCRGVRSPGGMALSPPARAALRHLRDCRLESALRVRLPVQATREVERALFEHLQYHNPQALRSREVLRSLLGQA